MLRACSYVDILPRELRDLLAQYVQPHLRLDLIDHLKLCLYEPCFSLVCEYKPTCSEEQLRNILLGKPLLYCSEGAIVALQYKHHELTLRLLGTASLGLVLTGQETIHKVLGRSILSGLDIYNVKVDVRELWLDLIYYIDVVLENSTCKLGISFSYGSGNLCAISRVENRLVLSSKEMELTLNPDLSSILLNKLCECKYLPESLIRIVA